MDGGVIGFSRKFEGKILFLDKILKTNSYAISKVFGGRFEVDNSSSGISIISTYFSTSMNRRRRYF